MSSRLNGTLVKLYLILKTIKIKGTLLKAQLQAAL